MREELAQLAHEQWSGWIKYMFKNCKKTINGELIVPKWAVDRWRRQASTPYSGLTPTEMDSDRAEADKFIAIFNQALRGFKDFR